MQQCLNKFSEWCSTWGMDFNVSKCKGMHIGRNNTCHQYSINGTILMETEVEKDIGVLVNKNLKPTSQCNEAARQGNRVLGQISRAFHYRDRHVFLNLYKQHVRPHLEFSVQAWCPWTSQDIDKLERVQKRAVGMISGLKGKDYETKLQELNLQSLAMRRTRFDMVQTFKILNNIDHVNPDTWFNTFGNTDIVTRNRAYPLNLLNRRAKGDVRKNFFSVRVINTWNSLPNDIKNAKSVNVFKIMYDKFQSS